MIIGILSDTHGRVAAAQKAISLLRSKDARYFIHCGDVGDGVLDVLPAKLSAFVFGNNDWDAAGLREEADRRSIRCLDFRGEIELAGKRIAVTHGDDPGILRSIRAAKSFDYLFTGHTHLAHDQREDSLRWINPGALHRAIRKTVATLDLANDQLVFHEVEGV